MRYESFKRLSLSDVPMLLPAAGFAGGISVGGHETGLAWVVSLMFIAAMAGLFLGKARIVVFLSAALTGAGLWLVYKPVCSFVGVYGDFSGEVVSSDDFGDMQRCVVETSRKCRIAVSVYGYPYMVEPGDMVRFSGRVLPPVTPTSVPDEYDGAFFARVNYLSGRCFVEGDDFGLVEPAGGLRGKINRLRYGLWEAIGHSGLSQQAAGFLGAILLGYDSLDDGVRAEFASAGLSHILALSGMHVSTIVLLVTVILLPVEMAGSRRWRVLMVLAILWGYAVLVGMIPSVVRAVVMATFVLVAGLAGRRSEPLNALCGAALLILLFDPAALFLPGFQLSFLAVAGIVILLPPVRGWLLASPFGNRRWARVAVTIVAVPIAAVVATAPLSAFHFHYFPVWFLVANIPVALVMPVAICVGVVMTAAVWLGFSGGILVEAFEWSYRFVEMTARVVAGLPGNNVGGNLYLPQWWVWLAYAAMAVVWMGWNTRRKVIAVNGVILLAGSVLVLPAVNQGMAKREIYPWECVNGVALVCREGGDVYLVTDARQKYYPVIDEAARHRLRDYLGKRGADLTRVCGDSLDLPGVRVAGNRWSVSGHEMFIVRSEEDLSLLDSMSNEIDVAVVSAGFRGDVTDVAVNAGCAQIVLSPSLPPARRRKYAADLSRAGVGCHLSLPELFDAE